MDKNNYYDCNNDVHILKKKYEEACQGHVFEYYNELSKHEQDALCNQLRSIAVPIEQLSSLFTTVADEASMASADCDQDYSAKEKEKEEEEEEDDDTITIIEPFDGPIGRNMNIDNSKPQLDTSLNSTSRSDSIDQWRRTGLDAIAQGHVAVIVLAGGQGTRLGVDSPKGCYVIDGLPSGKSLFALQAERIRKLQQLAAAQQQHYHRSDSGMDCDDNECIIPLYIMTSPLNHATTLQHFQSHHFFGLKERNVMLFAQEMLPCMSCMGGAQEQEGGTMKIIMESKGSIALAPNGNGGVYTSLASSGALDDMQKIRKRIRYMHVVSVDNALVRPADPVFIGYCIEHGADVGNKVVWKAHAHERVGVLAMKKTTKAKKKKMKCKSLQQEKEDDEEAESSTDTGRYPCIVEYSEITQAMAEQVNGDDDDVLTFGAANIANHFFTLNFITETVLPSMTQLYHVAHKKIPYYDATTNATIVPIQINGMKLESFIFDVFPLSKAMAVLEVSRNDEFAPIKNQSGEDSPQTALERMRDLSQRWIVAAGATLVGDVSKPCEILPSTSYAGEGLEAIVEASVGGVIECPFIL